MTEKSNVAAKWDPWKLMNVSSEELAAIKERRSMRDELKMKWQRMSTNPHIGGRGGHHLDPAVQRWLSARAVLAAHDYFKVTPRTLFTAIFLVWGPIIGLGYMVTKSRAELDAKCRSGEITARERIFKWKH